MGLRVVKVNVRVFQSTTVRNSISPIFMTPNPPKNLHISMKTGEAENAIAHQRQPDPLAGQGAQEAGGHYDTDTSEGADG